MQIRMMALVTACAGHEGEEVAFATVQEALQVESGDAEAWIVRAFGKQLLDGRIDQVRAIAPNLFSCFLWARFGCEWSCAKRVAIGPRPEPVRVVTYTRSARRVVAVCHAAVERVGCAQVQETVHVRRCERLVFDGDGWERLQRDLTAWHENLAGISVTMKESTLLTPTSTVQRWLSA